VPWGPVGQTAAPSLASARGPWEGTELEGNRSGTPGPRRGSSTRRDEALAPGARRETLSHADLGAAAAPEEPATTSPDDPKRPARAVRGRARFRRQVETRGPLAISTRDRVVRERLVRWINEGQAVLEALQRTLDAVGRLDPRADEASQPGERLRR
jgi:hypothetical protein